MKPLKLTIEQGTFIKPPNCVSFLRVCLSWFNYSFLGREAGDVYMKAGETEIKSGEADGSARKFLSASTCYKKIDPECNVLNFFN